MRSLQDLIVANEKELTAYRILDPKSLRAFLGNLQDVHALLGGRTEDWQVREVGDGNLNHVFIVEGSDGSVCVKQALPYVRAAGPSWPMSPERAFFENSYYLAVAPYVGALIPNIYYYDSELYCTVMERLSPHIILRQGLIAGRRYDNVARSIGEFIARACFFTSDFAQPSHLSATRRHRLDPSLRRAAQSCRSTLRTEIPHRNPSPRPR